MNVLLLTSHSIAEHDDLDMFTRMGVPTFSIGAYTDPARPSDDKRPPLPDAPYFPELAEATDAQRARMTELEGEPGYRIDWAKAALAPEVIDWADTVIVHHFPEQWIGGNWDALRDRRVIWRTCGQSDPRLEAAMSRYRREGLEIVRYSPKEREAFARWAFAGEDTMIRFGKDPDDWAGWVGELAVVGNVTQDLARRGDACGLPFWEAATADLPTMPAGPGSDVLRGGVGALTYDGMRDYLRSVGAYLYTGTRPASYTLGLIEAAMTGVPVVAMGPGNFYPPELYEAHEIVPLSAERPEDAAKVLADLLADRPLAEAVSEQQRSLAVAMFGLDRAMRDWADFLGVPL